MRSKNRNLIGYCAKYLVGKKRLKNVVFCHRLNALSIYKAMTQRGDMLSFERLMLLKNGFCIAPAIVAAGITAAGGIAGTALNKWFTDQTNQANLDYAMKVNQNKYQWAVEDAKKAGLSPLAVAGASQSGQSYTGVAPQSQIDGAAIADSYLSAQSAGLQERSIKNEEDRLAFEKQKWYDEHGGKVHDVFGETMDNNLQIANVAAKASRENAQTSAEASKYSADVAADTAAKNRESQESMHSKDLAQRIYEYGATAVESTRQFEELLKQNDKKAAADVALRSQGARIEEYRGLCQTLGVHVEIEYCNTIDEYEKALKVNAPLLESFYTKYADFLEKNPDLAYEQYSKSENDGQTISGGLTFGKGNQEGETHNNTDKSFSDKAKKFITDAASEFVGKNFNVGINGNYSTTDGSSLGYTQNERLKKECSRLLKECGYKFPILDIRY